MSLSHGRQYDDGISGFYWHLWSTDSEYCINMAGTHHSKIMQKLPKGEIKYGTN
jgi:hypothetical protein